jgi:hypothetical protein
VLKSVPSTETDVPGDPTVGEKLVIVGGPDEPEPTTKLVALVAEPFGVVTLTVPVVAPLGTVT